jgi:hypothetical protein
MKLTRLIELLEELRDDLNESLGDDCDPVVVAAYQPRYPLPGTVDGVACIEEDGGGQPILLDGHPVVWIAVGGHPWGINPSAARLAFEDLQR